MTRVTMFYRSLIVSVALAAVAGAAGGQVIHDAEPDEYDVPAGDIFMSDVSVLANDSVTPDDSLFAELVTGPAAGALTFRADGTFDYDPAGVSAGIQTFTYRTATMPLQRLQIRADESVLTFIAEVDPDQLAARQDTAEIAFVGTVTADLGEDGSRTDPVHVLGIDGRNRDAVHLLFDWEELIGRLNVDAEPDSLALGLAGVGPPVSAGGANGEFEQIGNTLGLTVIADIMATGLIAGSVEDGRALLAAETPWDMAGTLAVGPPIDLEFEVATFSVFDLDGNDVTVETSGSIRATADPVARTFSEPVEVVLNVAGTTASEDPAVPGVAHLAAVYPNPARTNATILLTGEPRPGRRAEVVDILGRTVHSVPLTAPRVDLDVSGLAPGIYLIRTRDDAARTLTLVKR